MKLFKWEVRFDKVSLLHLWIRVKESVGDLPYWFLVKQSRSLGIIVFALVVVLGIWLIVTLLYLKPPDLEIKEDAQLQLSDDAIDRLEYWIEVRQAERSKVLTKVRSDIFKVNPK